MFTQSFLSIRLQFVIALTCATLFMGIFIAQIPQAAAQVRSNANLTELQALLQSLMAQIAALQAGSNPTPAIEVLAVGSSVQPTANVRVRSVSNTTGVILGTVTPGNIGVVKAGPVKRGNVNWYQVSFKTDLTGWVAGTWLAKAGTSIVDVNTFVKTDNASNNKMEPGLEDASIVNIQVAPASFDRYANRVVLQFTPTEANGEDLPWVAFEDISLWANGWNIRNVNASDMSIWRKVGNSYQITVFSGNQKISPNRSYNFVLAVTSDEDTPTGDRWNVSVPAKGAIIWSQANGHMTNANAMATYPIEFVRSVNDSEIFIEGINNEANAEGENGELGDFTFEFEVTANDEDIYIKDSVSTVAKNGGIFVSVDGPEAASVTGAMTSSAEKDSGSYVIREGETENFSVNVWLKSTIAGNYRVAVNAINYSTTRDGVSTAFEPVPKEDFRSTVVSLTGQSGVTPIEYDITIYSPLQDQVYKSGDIVTVKWKTINLDKELVNITLFGNNTERHVLKNIPLNKGIATFKIPASDSLGAVEAGDYVLSVWVTGLKDSDPKNIKDSVKIKIGKGGVTPVLKPTPRFSETASSDDKGNTKASLVLESIRKPNDVTGPVVLGSINWGDGTVSEPISALIGRSTETAVTVNHVYKRSGTYEIVVTAKNGETITQSIVVNRVSPTPIKRPLTPAIPATTTSYTLTDISTVTKKLVDPNKAAIDDEYTLYTINLKNKKVHQVKVFGRQQTSVRDANFKKTGYTGDVIKLMAMAKTVTTPVALPKPTATTTPTPVVKGAATDVYTEILETLNNISVMLEQNR